MIFIAILVILAAGLARYYLHINPKTGGRMVDETIQLGKDPKDIDPSGINPQDKAMGFIDIPKEPVNLGDATIVDGVAEGGPDDTNPKTIDTISNPQTKGE